MDFRAAAGEVLGNNNRKRQGASGLMRMKVGSRTEGAGVGARCGNAPRKRAAARIAHHPAAAIRDLALSSGLGFAPESRHKIKSSACGSVTLDSPLVS